MTNNTHDTTITSTTPCRLALATGNAANVRPSARCPHPARRLFDDKHALVHSSDLCNSSRATQKTVHEHSMINIRLLSTWSQHVRKPQHRARCAHAVWCNTFHTDRRDNIPTEAALWLKERRILATSCPDYNTSPPPCCRHLSCHPDVSDGSTSPSQGNMPSALRIGAIETRLATGHMRPWPRATLDIARRTNPPDEQAVTRSDRLRSAFSAYGSSDNHTIRLLHLCMDVLKASTPLATTSATRREWCYGRNACLRHVVTWESAHGTSETGPSHAGTRHAVTIFNSYDDILRRAHTILAARR